MKPIMLYSSKTGNTEKICRAVADTIKDCKIFPVEEVPQLSEYDIIMLGFWVYRGKPDIKSIEIIEKINNKKVILLGTMGAWPDSEHALKCKNIATNMALAGNNQVLGIFLCQGKVNQGLIDKSPKKSYHPMTEERRARLIEAAKHPDAQDCFNAAKFAQECLMKI